MHPLGHAPGAQRDLIAVERRPHNGIDAIDRSTAAHVGAHVAARKALEVQMRPRRICTSRAFRAATCAPTCAARPPSTPSSSLRAAVNLARKSTGIPFAMNTASKGRAASIMPSAAWSIRVARKPDVGIRSATDRRTSESASICARAITTIGRM
jgi:hypothetical protein